MINRNNKDKAVASIYITKDYEKFSFIDGNRNVRPNHVEKLCNSFREVQLGVPLVVDKDYRIYDGQNRFMALKSLEFPIYYQIIDKMTLRMLQLLNSNASNWTTAQYCDSYCELGHAEYYKYKAFKKKYKLGVRESLNLLAGAISTANLESLFRDGGFVCKDYKNAIHKAEMLSELEPYVRFYRQRVFVNAMDVLFRNKIYDHSRFMKKIKKRSAKLTEQGTKRDYHKQIEEIYNWRESSENKVRLFTY
jgi:hypothetical protein|tara:strand:+ start:525 stop:1271 length:747 start_codon:yes stop_codon:yes gene_type:complete